MVDCMTPEEIESIKARCRKSNIGIWEGGLTTYRCAVCEKRFVIHNEGSWVYKRKKYRFHNGSVVLYLCSYGCTRKFDEIFDPPKKPIGLEDK